MRPRRLCAVVMCVPLAIASLAACTSAPKPDGTVDAYLRAWSAGDLVAAGKLTDAPAAAQAALSDAQAQVGVSNVHAARGRVTNKDKRGTAVFRVSWTIPGLTQPWTYAGRLLLVRPKDKWLIHWDPHDIHPRLAAGQRLRLTRTLPPRAAILDRANMPLSVQTEVVTVGVEQRKVTDLASLARALGTALGIDPAPIVRDVGRAKPTDFVTVITLRKSDYLRVRSAIHELPGTVFRAGVKDLAPSPHFAQPLLGRVGEATADVAAEAGAGYRPGDELGRTGLQRVLNSELAGTATGEISLIDGNGAAVATLATIAGHAGRPVRLTLDRGTQAAADAVLARIVLPAAIVAVKPSTGEILAVANSPAAPFDIALEGKYPPGSTFKIVTATAALTAGLVRPTDTVACPGTVAIGGRTIPNENSFALGQVPLRTAFAKSCNTTFAGLGARLDPAGFRRAAETYGIGAGWHLRVASFSGSVPAPSGLVERAFDAIGQGRVLVSPLAEALMAATVAFGSTQVPELVAEPPTPPEHNPSGGRLTPPVLASLREFTRAVVTEGTGTALAGVPGGPVAGKTGTAEFGTTKPPQAHSWFTGYQGDFAFAVFVYGGQTGGVLANPLATSFLLARPH